ncbi:MAG: DUF1674 domain-containing protein [Alphaproteobacteria bacterium]|nr:DUF1674 domain-containing protein [Alphaproteobacteria bacterium]
MDDERKSSAPEKKSEKKPEPPKEFGGRKGPEPTRYGDWENNGIASDF